MGFEAAVGKMRGSGRKATLQRLAILRALADEPSLTFGELRRRCGRVGVVTVYRTVEPLLELGIARRMDFGDGPRYELTGDYRHRLICEPCGRVFDLGERAPGLERSLLKGSGPGGIPTRMDVYGRCRGLCADCT